MSEQSFDEVRFAMNQTISKINMVYEAFFPKLLNNVYFLSQGQNGRVTQFKAIQGALSGEEIPYQTVRNQLGRHDIPDDENFLQNLVKSLLIPRETDAVVFLISPIISPKIPIPMFLVSEFFKPLWDLLPRFQNKMFHGEAQNVANYIYKILDFRCIRELNDIHMKRGHASLLTPREILSNAGSWLLSDYIEEFTGVPEFTFFDSIQQICALQYERKPTFGQIFLPQKAPASFTTLSFEKPIPLSSSRVIRKLFELSGSKNRIITTSGAALGIGPISPKRDPGLLLTLTGRNWKVEVNNENATYQAFSVEEGLIRFNDVKATIDFFKLVLREVFPSSSPDGIERISIIFQAVFDLPHGGIVIIDSHSEAEADRLYNRCIKISPVPCNRDLVETLTKVDGAVLVDKEGLCFAFGAILDGLANRNSGDNSRGSRFNSTQTYVNSRAKLAIGLVKSEDGYFNVIQ